MQASHCTVQPLYQEETKVEIISPGVFIASFVCVPVSSKSFSGSTGVFVPIFFRSTERKSSRTGDTDREYHVVIIVATPRRRRKKNPAVIVGFHSCTLFTNSEFLYHCYIYINRVQDTIINKINIFYTLTLKRKKTLMNL